MDKMIREIRKAVGNDFVIIGRTASDDKSDALQRAKSLKDSGSGLVIVEAINNSKLELKKLTNQGIGLTSIQLDKGQKDHWTSTDHKSIGLKLVLLANGLRKRWSDSMPVNISDYTQLLGLQAYTCSLGR